MAIQSTKLLNINTNQLEDIDNSQLDKAINSGQYKIVPGVKVPLKNPAGIIEWQDSDNIDDLATNGYLLPTEEEVVAAREHVVKKKEIEASPLETLKAGVEGGLKALTFGASDVILPTVGITDKESMALRRQTHPIAAGIGEAGTILGSLIVPGLGAAKAASALGKVVGSAKAASTAAKALSAYNPIYQISRGARGLEAAMMAKGVAPAAARIAGGAAEMVPYSLGSSLSERVLGDPNEASENLIKNLGLSMVLGGGITAGFEGISKGLGVLGKTMGWTDKTFARNLLGRLSDLDVNSPIFKEFDDAIQAHSLSASDDLAALLHSDTTAKAAEAQGLDKILYIQKTLAEKYPALRSGIYDLIKPTTTIADIPELQNQLFEHSRKNLKSVIKRFSEGRKKPTLLKPEFDEFAQYVKDNISILKNFSETEAPKLQSLSEQLLEHNTSNKPEYDNLLSQMTSSQLQSARKQVATAGRQLYEGISTGALAPKDIGPKIQQYQNIIDDLSSELQKIGRKADTLGHGVTSIESHLIPRAQITTEIKEAAKNDIKELADRINVRRFDLETDTINPSRFVQPLGDVADGLAAVTSKVNPITDTVETKLLGVRKMLDDGDFAGAFQTLRAQKRALDSIYWDKKLSPADFDRRNILSDTIQDINAILQKPEYFGEASKLYSAYNAIYSGATETTQAVLGRLFTRLAAPPTKDSGAFLYRGSYYVPNPGKIIKALTKEDIQAYNTLEHFVEAHSKGLDDYLVRTHPERMVEFKTVAPEDEILYLEHYSATPNIKELDPARHGTGVKGDESLRFDGTEPKRTYYYVAGQKPERLLGSKPYKYSAAIKASEIYDGAVDSLRLFEKSGGDRNILENSIKAAGYRGYTINKGTEKWSVAIFDKLKPYAESANLYRLEESVRQALPRDFTVITAEKPLFESTIKGGNTELENLLKQGKYDYKPALGKYSGEVQPSFLVKDLSSEEAMALGEKFGQESVYVTEGNKQRLLFTNGPNKGKYAEGSGIEVFTQPPLDNYTRIIVDEEPVYFSGKLNFDTLYPIQKPVALPPYPTKVVGEPKTLIRNLGDLKTLISLSTRKPGWSTDLFKTASRYGPLALAAYFFGASPHTIAITAAVGGAIKELEHNPMLYFQALDYLTRIAGRTNKIFRDTVRSNVMRGVKAIAVPKISKEMLTDEYKISEFPKVRKLVLDYADPAKRQQQIANTNDLHPAIMPQLSEAYTTKMNQMIDYLVARLPKGSNVNTLIDINKDTIVSDAEKRKFMQIYKYADNPDNLMQDFPNITMDAIETVRNLYPAYFSKLQQEIMSLLPELQGQKLNPTYQSAISKILGMNTGVAQDAEFYQTIQNNWTKAETPEEEEGPGGQLTSEEARAAQKMSERFKVNSQKALE